MFPHTLDRNPEDNIAEYTGTDSAEMARARLNRMDEETGLTVQWSGLHFRTSESHPVMSDREMVSYWIKEDRVEDDFDKELEIMINRDKNSRSLSVGQRKVNLDV